MSKPSLWFSLCGVFLLFSLILYLAQRPAPVRFAAQSLPDGTPQQPIRPLTGKRTKLSKLSGRFLGEFTNQDSSPIDRLTVNLSSSVAGQVLLRVWGRCQPSDCYWGEQATHIDNNVINVTWDQKFVIRQLTLSMIDPRNLLVSVRSHFTDNSGRPDYEFKEELVKQ